MEQKKRSHENVDASLRPYVSGDQTGIPEFAGNGLH